MSLLVVDASVAIKWFIQEAHSEASRSLPAGATRLIAPELIFPEVGHALLKRVRSGELPRREVELALADLSLFVDVIPASHLATAALRLAADQNRSMYDALYVALAIEQDCQFVTGDLRLYNALSPSLPDTMRWVGDLDPA